MRKESIFLRKAFMFAALMMTISAASAFTGTAAEYKTPVRIGLAYGTSATESVSFSAEGGFTVTVEEYAEEPASLDINELVFSVSDNALHASTLFGAEIAAAGIGTKIRLEPTDPQEYIQYADKPYRGAFEVYADSEGRITVINLLDLEDYLRGVLPSEVYASWNMEALKAAAVAARTYALRSTMSSSHTANGFDLCATTHCQVYSGVSKEHERTDEALLETAGLVLKYKDVLATTPYHSSNGGYTESAAAAWGSNPADFPYLTTVFTPYEDYRNVPNGKWESVILEEELLSYIAPTYLSRLTDGIADLDYTRENSGYIESMTVTDGQGNKVVLKNSGSVRSFFGKLVKSANFDIARAYIPDDSEITPVLSVISASGEYDLTGLNGYTYLSADGEHSTSGVKPVLVFDGCGYGHGVGLSQFGSRCMADAGFSYTEILETYFPGTDLVPLFSGDSDEDAE